MVGAAQHDPVAAIILHSNPSDIEYVIVDGVVRKSAGKLVNVDIDKRAQAHIDQPILSWEDVARQVIKRRDLRKGFRPGLTLFLARHLGMVT